MDHQVGLPDGVDGAALLFAVSVSAITTTRLATLLVFFMASAAIVAQELDHHPDWSNSYDRVTVRLSSHDVGGISQREAKKSPTRPSACDGRTPGGEQRRASGR